VTPGHPEPILDHGFDFRPAWWTRPYIQRTWSQPLHELPGAERGRGYHRITRRDLLAGPRPHDRGLLGGLLLACYVWGSGPVSFTVNRRRRVFRDTAADVLTERLGSAVETLGSDGPVAAYASLHDDGPHRTKHMRASFFTKFLYAADAPGDGSCGRALILDQFVAIGLNDRHGWRLPEKGGWSPDTYGRWLQHAHDLAGEQTRTTGVPVRPDDVERDYFWHGREVDAARR